MHCQCNNIKKKQLWNNCTFKFKLCFNVIIHVNTLIKYNCTINSLHSLIKHIANLINHLYIQSIEYVNIDKKNHYT